MLSFWAFLNEDVPCIQLYCHKVIWSFLNKVLLSFLNKAVLTHKDVLYFLNKALVDKQSCDCLKLNDASVILCKFVIVKVVNKVCVKLASFCANL